MLVHLLDGGARTFRWSFAPPWNTQPTDTTLHLRFSNQGKGVKPRELVYLEGGGGFNSAYNDARVEHDIDIPANAARVEVFAIITGHGMDTNNCAEFCRHEHVFTVNGNAHLQEYPMVGDQEGCLKQIGNGAVPNQSGTWWYGRGGWCPGMQVDPFVVDVTSEAPAGSTATVSYQGRYNGGTIPDASGNISMNSYLVIYE